MIHEISPDTTNEARGTTATATAAAATITADRLTHPRPNPEGHPRRAAAEGGNGPTLFGDRDRADYGFDRRAPPTGNDGYGDQSKRARRDSPPRDRYDGDRGYGAYDRDRGYDDRRGPPRSPPRDSRSGAPPPSSGGRGGDGYGGGFDDRAPPPSSYDRGRGRDADYPPPPRGRDASRDREGGRDGQSGPDQDEHQMEVPAEVAKIVIGSHGSAIKELQDRTGAHVMIYKPQPGARESGYRPVMIRGSRRSVDLATDELRRVVRDYEDGVVGGKDRRPPALRRQRRLRRTRRLRRRVPRERSRRALRPLRGSRPAPRPRRRIRRSTRIFPSAASIRPTRRPRRVCRGKRAVPAREPRARHRQRRQDRPAHRARDGRAHQQPRRRTLPRDPRAGDFGS